MVSSGYIPRGAYNHLKIHSASSFHVHYHLLIIFYNGPIIELKPLKFQFKEILRYRYVNLTKEIECILLLISTMLRD